MNEMLKMTDRELVSIRKTSNSINERNWAGEILYKRYERQIHKNWLRLCAQMNNTPLIMSMQEDYYDEATEAFLTAIDKTDLNKIKDDDWKLVGMLNWYLANVRKKIIRIAMKQGVVKSISHMKNISGEDSLACDPDVEESYWETVGYKTEPSYVLESKEKSARYLDVLDKCKSNWHKGSGIEIEILDRLQNKKTRQEIAQDLNLTTSKVYSIIKNMRKEIASCFY